MGGIWFMGFIRTRNVENVSGLRHVLDHEIQDSRQIGRVHLRCQEVGSQTAPDALVVMAMKCCHVSVHFQI